MARQIIMANPRSSAEIEAIALRFVQKYQPNVLGGDPEPFDILKFFDCYMERDYGVSSDYSITPLSAYAYTDINDMKAVVSSALIDDDSQETFLRATVSHEVGHVVLHIDEFRKRKKLLRFMHDDENVKLRLYREDQVVVYRNPEWQAWRFAGAVMMPASVVYRAANKGIGSYQMSALFNVSHAFLMTRLRALKLTDSVKFI
jgi:Zn-dependent peptidase ImmA (M78 family)